MMIRYGPMWLWFVERKTMLKMSLMGVYVAEMLRLQEFMRCKGCEFVDEKMLGKGPCCIYPSKLKIAESGHCLSRQEKQDE